MEKQDVPFDKTPPLGYKYRRVATLLLVDQSYHTEEKPMKHLELEKIKLRHVLLLVTCLTSVLVGCVQVDIVDRGCVKENLIAQNTSHNLSSAGIIFEPPLDEIGRSTLRQGVNLFVEVKNNGTQVETNVTVQITLETAGQHSPLMQRQAIIPQITPDQSQQAHFRLTEMVDLEPHYILHVNVVPCAGETLLKDNERIFDLYITPRP